MTFSLTEIQITSVILMGLFTLVIAFIVPHYTKNVRIFVVTRRLLLCATSLVTLHFLVQYILHKNTVPAESTRTMLNILFGFPSSYFFTLALMYLVRRGNIKRSEWIFIPLVYIIALLILVGSLTLKVPVDNILPSIAFLYAIALLHCSALQIRGFFDIKAQQMKGDHSYDLLRKWTQWSLFLMPGVGLGFPFVIFASSVTVRSIYGILTIAVAFICILGILGYTLSYNVMAGFIEKQKMENSNSVSEKTVQEEKIDTSNSNDEPVSVSTAECSISDSENEEDDDADNENRPLITIDDARRALIIAATTKFVNERKFTRSGMTMKDAASEMNVPLHLLRTWLRTTEYVKFNNWLIAMRIEYAKELLSENPSLTNEVVAMKCGFCDRQYFQTMFCKIVGVTPFKWVKGNVFKKAVSSNDKSEG